MKRRWILYTRVSTDEQVSGASLEAQLAACQSFANAKGWGPVEAITDAGASGKNLHRPGAERIMAGANEGNVAGLIVWRLDRWTRSLRDLIDSIAALEASGAAFVSVTESIDTSGPMGRFVLHLLGALAQLERETISQRVKLGIHRRMAEGTYIGGRMPAGLQVGKDRKIVANGTTSKAIAACWGMARNGGSLLDCARHLTKAKVPGSWTKTRIASLLRCQKYRGILVSAVEQDQAIAALGFVPSPGNRVAGRIRSTQQQPSNRVWRLHGVAVCFRCGASLAGSHSTGNGGPIAYLRCTGRMRGNKCDAPNLPAEAYENLIVQELAKELSDGPKLIRRIQATAAAAEKQAAPAAADRKLAQGELDRTQAVLDRALNLALEGGPTARAVTAKIGELQQQVEAIQNRIAVADGAMAAMNVSRLDTDVMVQAIETHAKGLPSLPWEDQAKAIKELVHVIRLDVDRFEVEISPPGAQQKMVRKGVPGKLSEPNTLRTIWTHAVTIERKKGWRGKWMVQSA